MMDLTSEAILLSMITFYFGIKLYLYFINSNNLLIISCALFGRIIFIIFFIF